MKKDEFIELVQKQGDYETKKEAAEAIKTVTSAIAEALSSRKRVALAGFGIFEASIQKGRTGKIPGTDKTYTTEDKYIPKFKAGKALKGILEKA